MLVSTVCFSWLTYIKPPPRSINTNRGGKGIIAPPPPPPGAEGVMLMMKRFLWAIERDHSVTNSTGGKKKTLSGKNNKIHLEILARENIKAVTSKKPLDLFPLNSWGTGQEAGRGSDMYMSRVLKRVTYIWYAYKKERHVYGMYLKW